MAPPSPWWGMGLLGAPCYATGVFTPQPRDGPLGSRTWNLMRGTKNERPLNYPLV